MPFKITASLLLMLISGNSWADYTKYFAAVSDIREICQGINRFYYDIGRVPTSDEGIDALFANSTISNWRGPYLKRRFSEDSWSNRLNYYYPARYGNHQYDLYSNGQNKENDYGDKDDIANWKLFHIDSCNIKHAR